MSLDVYLEVGGDGAALPAKERIFIREAGRMREVSRDEWDRQQPGREPATVTDDGASGEVYSANITHNMGSMASEAGIYKHLWRPEEVDVKTAADLIGPLSDGLAILNSEPERFQKFNPSNGWGNYEGLVQFVGDYLAACQRWPMAKVRIWR